MACPHYTYTNRRAKNVELCLSSVIRGLIQYSAVDTEAYEIIAVELTVSGVADAKYFLAFSNKLAIQLDKYQEMEPTIQNYVTEPYDQKTVSFIPPRRQCCRLEETTPA